MTDVFWSNQPEILYQSNRLIEFFPSKEQTTEERLNAIMRFSVYVSLLLVIYHRDARYLSIAVGCGILTFFIYKNSPLAPNTTVVKHDSSYRNTNENATAHVPVEQFQEGECYEPTPDNPFMNATMGDYMNIKDNRIVDRPPACDPNDPTIKKKMDDLFNESLYKDTTDLFGKMNSQRQFFTMPYTTIPNRQDDFAKWLYASPPTCKEDQDYCLRYEDIRAKRPEVYDPMVNPAKKN